MPRTLLCCLVLLVLCVDATDIAVQADQPATSPKVELELFYQTLCPHCHHYFVGTLSPLLSKSDVSAVLMVKLIPYGNAKTRMAINGTPIFECQHGKAQCEGNIFHNCAIDAYGITRAFEFIMCLEQTDKNWQVDGSNCASRAGIDWRSISGCSSSSKGAQLHLQAGILTKAQKVRRVPYVRINGQHLTGTTVNGDGLLRTVCKLYRGPAPKSCEQLSEDDSIQGV